MSPKEAPIVNRAAGHSNRYCRVGQSAEIARSNASEKPSPQVIGMFGAYPLLAVSAFIPPLSPLP